MACMPDTITPSARQWAQIKRLRRSGWTVNVWGQDGDRLLVDGLEPGGTFEQGYGFRGSIDPHGNMTAEPAIEGD